MFDFYYMWYQYWMEIIFDIASVQKDLNIQKERVDKLEKIIYECYI